MRADQVHLRRHGSGRRPAPGGVTRRVLVAALALLLGSTAIPASAAGAKVKVGVLKLSSSAPIFLGVERGTFREFGIEPVQDRERAIAFMKGYVKAARLFFDAVLARKDGKPPAGSAYDEVVSITVRYTGATPEVVRVGFPYQDRDARLDVADIGRQLTWYQKAGMVTTPLQTRDLVDGSFLEEALRALPR